MMEQNPSRPARKVAIADHIWEVFDEMAQQMGSDRDALINQAMFMFARLNGFLDSAVANGGAAARPAAKGAQPVLSPVAKPPVREEPPPPAPLRRPAEDRAQQQQRLDDDPVRREVAERVLETAAELERLIKGKNDRAEEQEEPLQDEPLGDEPMEEELPPEDSELSGGEEGSEPGGAQLYLMMEGGEMDRVTKDRFIIGRGKHCDFVINSGKVSREHAMIVREAEEYFIEDLGSSNGTWFNKQRIKRRKIEDGDEYYICSEKIKVVMR